MAKGKDRAIIIKDLVKTFDTKEKEKGLAGSIKSLISPQKGKVRALKGISFTIKKGELVGFIGPNGAGKTTTMKILSGLLYPSDGLVHVLGYEPWKRSRKFLKEISLVMGQKNQLWWDLPAIDTLELNKAIYEIPDKEYKESLSELVNMLEIRKLLNTQVRKLSLGQRMRLELVASLIHRPKTLFLDEPTLGLDVVAQQKMREFISSYNKKNAATILLTSHDMDDILDLVKRVIVIDEGEIIFDGKLENLVGEYAKEKIIKIYLSQEIDFKKLEEIGEVREIDYPKAEIAVEREAVALAASELLQNFPIADLTIEEEDIEDVIRAVFRNGPNEPETK